MLRVDNLKRPPAARHRKKRVGCGPGSGHGKTSCRGHKGQGQHAGSKTYIGFEGGKVPLFRHLPKRGFTNRWAKEFQIVNLSLIDKKFNKDEEVNKEELWKRGLIKKKNVEVKILAKGELSKPLKFRLLNFSKQAEKKILDIGGKILR